MSNMRLNESEMSFLFINVSSSHNLSSRSRVRDLVLRPLAISSNVYSAHDWNEARCQPENTHTYRAPRNRYIIMLLIIRRGRSSQSPVNARGLGHYDTSCWFKYPPYRQSGSLMRPRCDDKLPSRRFSRQRRRSQSIPRTGTQSPLLRVERNWMTLSAICAVTYTSYHIARRIMRNYREIFSFHPSILHHLVIQLGDEK